MGKIICAGLGPGDPDLMSVKADRTIRGAILWLDMSVIDLGHAAGTIGLNPGGLKPQTLVDSVQQMTCDWQSIVITGMAPELDKRGVTELVALETINAALRNG